MKMETGNVYTGCSGWTRTDWRRTVYGRTEATGWHALDQLGRQVELAEIDSTFDEPLRTEVGKVYARKAARHERFLYTALVGRRFTYDRDLDAGAVKAWAAGFAPLSDAGRLGALVLQFPWAFRFNEENRQHLIRLRRAFADFPLTAEMRHDSWLCDEAVTTLVNYHVGLANIDQPAYFRAMPAGAHLTSGVAMVRLHGRQGAEAFRDFHAAQDRRYLYGVKELGEWSERIGRLAQNASQVLVVFTNAESGRAMVNALQMKAELGRAAGGSAKAAQAA